MNAQSTPERNDTGQAQRMEKIRTPEQSPHRCQKRGSKFFLWATLLLLAAGSTLFFVHRHSHAGFGHPVGPLFFQGGPFQHQARFLGDRLLDEVEADSGQKERILAEIQRTMTDLAPLAEQHRALKKRFFTALGQETIDPETLTALRRELLTLGDRLSERLLDGLLVAAGELTREQRQKLLTPGDRTCR